MQTEDAITLWCDTELRQYIVDVALALTMDEKLEADLIAKAWEILSQAPAGRTDEWYRNTVTHVMKQELLKRKYRGKE